MRNIYSFGPFRLDPEAMRLFRGDKPVRLRPKAAHLLRVLLERSHLLVRYGELGQLVWEQPHTERHLILVTVNELRKVLGKHGEFIENEATIGFRFRHPDFSPAAEHGRRSVQLTFVGLGNVALERGHEYLAALAFDLETSLSTVEAFRVIRATPQTAKRAEPIPGSAHYVLEGSLSGSADHLKVSIQIRDGDSIVWGETFSASAKELPGLASKLATRIAHAVKKTFNIQELTVMRSDDVDAGTYQLYLRGLHHWSRPTERDLLRAIDYFRQACQERAYAPALAGIARAYGLLALGGYMAPDAAGPESRDAALRCLEVNPRSAEGLTALAATEAYHNWDWRKAEELLQKAIQANDRYDTGHHVYAMACLMPQGNLDAALREIRVAESLNPLSPFVVTCVGIVHYYARAYDDAITQFDTALELQPHYHLALWHRGWALSALGRFDEAIANTSKAAEFSDNAIQVLASLAQVYAAAGKKKESHSIENHLQELAATRYVCPYHLALVKVSQGNKAEAIRLLREAAVQRVPALTRVAIQPILDPLRRERDFKRLLAEMKIPGPSARRGTSPKGSRSRSSA